MVKFDELKIGDMISYDGKVARVVEKRNTTGENVHPIIRIVGPTIDKRLHPADVQLMESIELPKLKVGDTVHVDDIPECERTLHDGIWIPPMSNHIGKDYTIKEVWDHSIYGTLIKLGEWWFRAYHVSPLKPYDMI